MYRMVPLAQVTALTDVLSVPSGYARFYRTNLAMELAASFTVQPSPALVTKALEAKASVKRRNLRVDELSVREVSALGAAGTLSRSRFDRGAF